MTHFKEELVAGMHGVEGRYPFLDREVVQEFLGRIRSLTNEHSLKSRLALVSRACVLTGKQKISLELKQNAYDAFYRARNIMRRVSKKTIFTLSSSPVTEVRGFRDTGADQESTTFLQF